MKMKQVLLEKVTINICLGNEQEKINKAMNLFLNKRFVKKNISKTFRVPKTADGNLVENSFNPKIFTKGAVR